MKFILVVFLGFCAFAKSSELADIEHVSVNFLIKEAKIGNHILSHSVKQLNEKFKGLDWVEDKVKNFLEKTLDKIIAEFNSHLDVFNNVKNYFNNKVKYSIHQANNIIEDKISKIEQKIFQLKMKGDANKKCAEKYELEIYDYKNITINNIKECASKIVTLVKEFTIKVDHKVLKLTFHVTELIKHVFETFIKGGTGIFVEIKDIIDVIKDIVADTKGLIATVKMQTHHFLAAAQNCKRDYITALDQKINNIRIKLHECEYVNGTDPKTENLNKPKYLLRYLVR